MSLEVEAEASGESGASKPRAELFQHCAALPIGDAVEVQEGLVRVGHGSSDWVRRW